MPSTYGVFQTSLCTAFITIVLITSFDCSSQTDVDCLRSIKQSLQDPNGSLDSWNFDNSTKGFICRFQGIECWHEDDSKVLNIKLRYMGLKGQFPRGIAECSSVTGVDLSHNDLYGNIPSDISRLVGYATTLDISSNQFSGQIPEDIANCSYLNELRLNDNQFSGQIPLRIGLLNRLKAFDVSNNRLNGPVPVFTNSTSNIGRDSYAGNSGLCGGPLPPCRGRKNSTFTVIGVVCGVAVAALISGLGALYMRKVSRKKKKVEGDPLGNKWAKNIKGAKHVQLSTFEKSVSKMSLSDLMKATNNFSNENIIGSGRTGTVYKAVLGDGTSLMVKRLQDTQHSEKDFTSEMKTLGSIKNKSLVPLLGYCTTKKERFLVYKYMPNGTLYDKLHSIKVGEKALNWPMRLKIGIRAAKGFAWLHHSCNPRILHRNISSKCILLDSDYDPKISDFGLARLMNPVDTHLSTFVNGEFSDLGYVAPEYARTLMATPKGDVFSFGVVLLELATGEGPTHISKAHDGFNGTLVDWVSNLSMSSKLEDAVDGSLVGKGFDAEVFQFLKVACRCVLAPSAKERPTMFEVYQLLRAVGQRYDFTTQDDVLVLSEDGSDDDQLVELIVARDA